MTPPTGQGPRRHLCVRVALAGLAMVAAGASPALAEVSITSAGLKPATTGQLQIAAVSACDAGTTQLIVSVLSAVSVTTATSPTGEVKVETPSPSAQIITLTPPGPTPPGDPMVIDVSVQVGEELYAGIDIPVPVLMLCADNSAVSYNDAVGGLRAPRLPVVGGAPPVFTADMPAADTDATSTMAPADSSSAWWHPALLAAAVVMSVCAVVLGGLWLLARRQRHG